MNATILDQIAAAFVGALQAGIATLQGFSLLLLGAFALIALYLALGPLVMNEGAGLGDTLGSLVLTVVKIGVFYWLLVNLIPLSTAAFLTFLQWGIAPAGSGIDPATFLTPSRLIDLGFRAAFPLQQFLTRLTGTGVLLNFPVVVTYMVSYWIIIFTFAFVAIHLMVTIIEFYLAVMVSAVLIPWGILQPTAFFAEFSIGWVTGGLIRILVTAGIVGIAIPLFDLVTFRTTGGGDPTLYSALVIALTSVVFAILSWIIPGRAAAIAGRGVSLALHGGTLIAGAASGARGVIAVTGAIRGVSNLVARR